MNDPQIAKVASVIALVITLFVAFWLTMALGFAALFLAFIQHLLTPGETPFRVERIGWFVLAVDLPAAFLGVFYVASLFRAWSRNVLLGGWVFSALYHAALTVLLAFYTPATYSTGGGPRTPVWCLTAAALLISIYLVFRVARSHPAARAVEQPRVF